MADKIALRYGFWFWRDGSTHAFTQLVANAEGFTYFCINFPDELQRSIIEAAKESSTEISKPLFLDIMVANGLLKSYRDAVESQRTTLLQIVCPFWEPSMNLDRVFTVTLHRRKTKTDPALTVEPNNSTRLLSSGTLSGKIFPI